MTITIGYATAHYSPMGMHVKYALQCIAHDDGLRWVVHKRYTECKTLHTQLLDAVNKRNGGGFVRFLAQSIGMNNPLPPFPEKLLGAANRTRTTIEQRRLALQNFFSALCDTRTQFYGVMRPYLLSFVSHPDACDNQPGQQDAAESKGSDTVPVGGADSASTCSETFPYDCDDIRPNCVETVWRVRKGDSYFDPHLLLSRPCAHIAMDVDNQPHIVLRTDRGAQVSRPALQHMYNEFVSFCRHVESFGNLLPTCDDAHNFFLMFRKHNPQVESPISQPRNPYGRETRPTELLVPDSLASPPTPPPPPPHDHELVIPPRTNSFTSFTIRCLRAQPDRKGRGSSNTMHLLGHDDDPRDFAPHAGCKCTDTSLCRDLPKLQNKYVTKCHVDIVISPPNVHGAVVHKKI
jgi:hypothetical protein